MTSEMSIIRIDHPALRLESRDPINKSDELDRPKRMSGRFIRGPIPLEWLAVAIPLGRKSLNVALAIWHLDGFQRTEGHELRLTPTVLSLFSVTPQSARKILHQFSKHRLIMLDSRRGRSPRVVLIRNITAGVNGDVEEASHT